MLKEGDKKLEDKKIGSGAREIKQLVTLHRGSSQRDLIMFSVKLSEVKLHLYPLDWRKQTRRCFQEADVHLQTPKVKRAS